VELIRLKNFINGRVLDAVWDNEEYIAFIEHSEFYIYNLVVHKKKRGMGYGRRIVNSICKNKTPIGIKKSAKGFWCKMGYKKLEKMIK
jgi:GNAT superfamily N-acetyltransferase